MSPSWLARLRDHVAQLDAALDRARLSLREAEVAAIRARDELAAAERSLPVTAQKTQAEQVAWWGAWEANDRRGR